MASSTFKPSSAASPKTRDLTKYFSPSPKKRARKSLEKDNSENEINCVSRKRQRGAAISRLNLIEIDKSATILENGVALVRINNSDSIPGNKCVRVGDPDTYLLHEKAIIGRSLAPCANSKSLTKKFRNQKIDLGIHGAGSGVSRKQLQVLKLEPLTFKQLKGVTNQISIERYNQIQKRMERSRTIALDEEFILNVNDVINMDVFKKEGRQHCFRVKKCLTPPLRARKQSLGTKTKQSSPSKMIDLVHSGSVSFTPTSVSSNDEMRTKSEIRSQRQMTTTKTEKHKKNETKTKIPAETEIVVPATPISLVTNNKQGREREYCIANSMPLNAVATRTMSSTSASKGNLSIPKLTTPDETEGNATNDLTSEMASNESITMQLKQLHDGTISKAVLKEVMSQPNIREKNEQTVCATKKFIGQKAPISTRSVSQKLQNDNGTPTRLPEIPEDCIEENAIKIEVEQLDEAVSNISRSPEVGNFFRVKYKTSDTFRVKGNDRFYESWHLGKVEKVTKLPKQADNGASIYKLKLVFLDKTSRDLTFPGDDIEMIENSEESDLLYALTPKGTSVHRENAFDRNPKKLMVGDLVDVCYQNGLDNNKWYRGRIAAVNTLSNSCTVAYDDGEVECLVPMNDGKIMLVEKGCVNSNWLLKLGIYDDFGRKTKKKKKNIPNEEIGTVVRIDHDDEDVKITIDFHKGVKRDCVYYNDFVSYLFDSLLSRYESSKTWPTADSGSEESGLETQVKGHVKEPCPKQQKRKPTSRKQKIKKFCEEEWHPIKEEAPTSEPKMEIECMKEMHPTLSNSFFRALNTSEPSLGTDLLIHTALFHNRGINATLGEKIRELLIDGPMSEGTNFPDAHRLETSIRYIKILARTKEGSGNLVKFCCPEEWSKFQEMFQAIVEPCYTHSGDTSASNKSALRRISDSLHLSAVGAQFLAKLFDAELGELVEQRIIKQNKYREGCLAKAMWSNESGPRQSLKELTKVFVQAWIKFGHYAVCKLPFERDSSDLALRRKCREDAKLLLKEIGTIVSYAIRLYSVVEIVHLNHKDLVYIIKDAFQTESVAATKSDLGAYNVYSKRGLSSSYQTHLKLQLVLSLDSNLVTDVQTNLAKELGVKKEYSSIVG